MFGPSYFKTPAPRGWPLPAADSMEVSPNGRILKCTYGNEVYYLRLILLSSNFDGNTDILRPAHNKDQSTIKDQVELMTELRASIPSLIPFDILAVFRNEVPLRGNNDNLDKPELLISTKDLGEDFIYLNDYRAPKQENYKQHIFQIISQINQHIEDFLNPEHQQTRFYYDAILPRQVMMSKDNFYFIDVDPVFISRESILRLGVLGVKAFLTYLNSNLMMELLILSRIAKIEDSDDMKRFIVLYEELTDWIESVASSPMGSESEY